MKKNTLKLFLFVVTKKSHKLIFPKIFIIRALYSIYLKVWGENHEF